MMDPHIELLRQSKLCEGIDNADLARLAAKLTPMNLQAGEYLFRVGDPIDNVCIVATGRVKVTVPAENNAEHELMYFNPGDFIGHNYVLDTGSSPANAMAIGPCEVLMLPGKDFLEFFATIPRLALNMVRALNSRVRQIVGFQKSSGLAKTVCAVYAGPSGQRLVTHVKAELAAKGERVADFEIADFDQQTSAPLEQWDELVRSNDRVFLSVDLDRPAEGWFDFARRCHRILWLIDPAREANMQSAFDHLRERFPQLPNLALIVWVLPEGTMVAPFRPAFWSETARHFMVTMSAQPESTSRLQQQGIDRLVRKLRGITLGLALAGGGARGMAHLGVLRALERERISFDYLAGTSSGAMVGINYAAGYTPVFCIEAFRRDLKPSRLWSLIPRGRNWHVLWKFRTRSWEGMLRRYLHDWTLQQLPIPFYAVTVDLVTGREIVRQTGDAVHAILESINLPGMSVPINRDGMSLVDGGILNNLPADILAGRGADLVVGVSVSRKLRHEFAGNQPNMSTEQMRKASTLETLYRIFETQGHGMDMIHAQSVDVLIEPDTSAFNFVDFTRAADLADVGDAATAAAIPVLKAKLAKLEQRVSAQIQPTQEEFLIKPVLQMI